MKYLIIQALYFFQRFLDVMIIIRCLLSWLPVRGDNVFIRFLYAVTEPIMGPFRKMLYRSPLGGNMGVDFSPVLACMVMHMVFQVLIGVVYSL